MSGPDNTKISDGGSQNLTLSDHDTVTLSGGGNTLTGHDHDVITIAGGSNNVTVHAYDSLTINDARSEAAGFVGSVNFGDTINENTNDTISLNYNLTLGNSDSVTVGFPPSITEDQTLLGGVLGLLTGGPKNTTNESFSVDAAAHDMISFSGSGEVLSLTLGRGDTIATTGSDDTITIGGAATTRSMMTVDATAAGTTIDGGLGTDTFTAGSGYDGSNDFVGSAHGYQDGFNAIGNCANYGNLTCRVSVNYNTDVGQGFDANGNLLWTDTYSNMQQVKAAQLDGNVLTGSNAYFCELKGGLGSTTYYDGTAGDRIIWSSAGATGLLDGQSTDVAYAGSGDDEFYWRNSPGGKGVSNLGETIYGFNVAQGDDLNLSEFADNGFAGVTRAFAGAGDLANWVSLTLNGNDTDVWFDRTGSGNFTQLAADLKNVNLFSAFGVTDYGSVGVQQVVQGMYSTGHLVLAQPH